jgi:type III pantothenate kinase
MILLIDIGNTRLKWAQFHSGELGAQSAAVHRTWTRDDFISNVLKAGPPSRVLISNVGGETIAALANESIRSIYGVQPEFVLPTAHAGGVRSGYANPAQLGVDRWVALIGARSVESRACCVVSVGTAMTIDGIDPSGQHLGGVIVPGPDLMVSSLFANTNGIAQRAQTGTTRETLFADNTLGAVKQGAVHALAAVIERAVSTMQHRFGTPELLITGGGIDELRAALSASYREIPDLVLRGLATLAASDPNHSI